MENELVTLGAQAEKEIAPITSNAALIAESIKDESTYVAASLYLQKIKSARNRVSEILDPFVQTAYAAWKKAVAERNKYDDPLNKAEDIVKLAMAKWYTIEQEQLAAQRRRLEEESRKREEERMIAEAEAAVQNGDHATADAILEAPINVAPPIIPSTPQAGGISMRDQWKYEVTNLLELVKAVAAGKVPLGALKANDIFLGQQTRSLKGEMKYPGVRVWSQKNVASRSF